ncbi:sensor histidine kinase [Nocardioides ultimimeridianus]
MLDRGLAMGTRWKRRIETHCLAHGISYPWYVPVLTSVATFVCAVVALSMRDALWPLNPLSVVLVLVPAAGAIQLGFGVWLPWYVDVLGPVTGAALLLATPTSTHLPGLDAVPVLLMCVTGESTGRDGVRPGTAVALVCATVLSVHAALTDPAVLPFQLLTLLLGYVVGAMILWQGRALAAERIAREQAWQQATMAERQRIARDIHDLVAHSLSVTMLHLTGARHALRDLGAAASPADVAQTAGEVDAALADAEAVGRQAMTDIRATVSTLASGPSPLTPLPDATGIAGLVDQFRAAGLVVAYEERGDLSRLPEPTGLGLFRIAQESLSNAVKHAPGAPVSMRVAVSDRQVRLSVRNPAPAGRRPGVGSGLAGMHTRAEQLGATLSVGGRDDGWTVDLRLPVGRGGLRCPVDLLTGVPAEAQ